MDQSSHADSERRAPGRGVIERADGSRYLEPGRADAFLGLVRAGDALVRTFNHTLQTEHGLSLRQFEVLLFLAVFADNHTMQMSDLRRRTPLSQSRVSRVVAGLEVDGLVTRTTDPTDTRSVDVTITEQGKAAFKAAQDRHIKDLEQHLFSQLTEQEINQLATITKKILAPQTSGINAVDQE